MFSFLFLSLLAATPSALGHGYLSGFAVDGKWYDGNTPATSSPAQSPIRLISTIDPVMLKDQDQSNLICGQNAQKAAMVVPANPGSQISFRWGDTGGQNWPHVVGPLMTYMASCGDTSCDQLDPQGLKWFKIDEAGQKSDGTWYQADFQKSSSASYEATLPQNIAPGGYLIRHEIIALHNAVSQNGAEFYPSCTQVQIGGNGNGQPSSTVSFPGAYSATDPGILVDVYSGNLKYVFPGGPLSNLAGPSEADSDPSASVDPSGSTASPSPSGQPGSPSTGGNGGPSPSAAPTGGVSSGGSQGGGTCQLKRSATSANVNLPRHYSRVMRRLLHHATPAASF